MSKDDTAIGTFAPIIEGLGEQAQSAFAIWSAAIIEDYLANVLAFYMPNLSNRLREKLFSGYGPFSSFSAKIDVAYTLGLITSDMRRDLHVFRGIRNTYAHSTEMLHFRSSSIQKLLKKFSDFRPEKDPYLYYSDKFRDTLSALNPTIQRLHLVKALRDHAEYGASPEKPDAPPPHHRPQSRDGSKG